MRSDLEEILRDHLPYINPNPRCFWGVQNGLDESNYAVLGIPYDETVTWRPGTRLGPASIRDASLCIDTYSWRTDQDLNELKIHDIGDLNIAGGDFHDTMKRIRVVFQDLVSVNKIPILLGGEHSVTLGAATTGDLKILDFDAHMDARDEYPTGRKYSHATVFRRMVETIGGKNIVQVGVRTASKEELEFARSNELTYFTVYDLHRVGTSNVIDAIREDLKGSRRIYISIDIDVLDACFAPGTTFPSPEGINLDTLFNILSGFVDRRVVGFDVVEVAPPYDHGNITSLHAARIVVELIALIHKARRLRE